MTRHILLLLLSLIIALPAPAEKRAFTLQDLYEIKSIGAPHISPTGSQVAFTVTTYDLVHSERSTHLWLMNMDGSDLHQLTEGDLSVSHPRWHPGGHSLLYVATDSVTEAPQAFQIDLSGDSVQKLTEFSMGVSAPNWSPNGDYLVFTSRVFPDAGTNSALNNSIQDDMDAGPVHAHVTDDLFYRHWDFYKDGKRRHTFALNLDTKTLTDLTPGEYESPRFDLGGGDGYDISPDGQEVVYVSNHDPEPQSSTNGDLWIVPIDSGSAINITEDNTAFDGHPRYSPDGRYIAYTLQQKPGYESDLFMLAMYDGQTGEHTILTEHFHNWITDFQWAPDSKGIYFSAPVHGNYPIFVIDTKSRKIDTVVSDIYNRGFDIHPDNNQLVFASSRVDQPTTIFSVSSGGENQTQLTHFNRQLIDSVDFRPAESTWITSTDGTKIQIFIVKPHNFDPERKYPLILNVHGGPQGMFGDSFRGDYQIYPGYGYIVAYSNPRGSIGYGQKFTTQISGDWGGQVFDDLMEVTDYLESLPYVDTEKMGAMGWSYGGYMMNWFEGHTTRFKTLASMMGVYDLESMYGATEELWFPEWDLQGKPWTSDLYGKWSPSGYVENFSTPCLVITGEKDYRVPYTQSLQLFTALQERDVPSRLIVFENDGHWPDYLKSMPLYYNAHLEWFHEYLGGDPAPFTTKQMWRNRIFKWGAQD